MRRSIGPHDAFDFPAKRIDLAAGQPIHSIARRKGEEQNTRITSEGELNFVMVATYQAWTLAIPPLDPLRQPAAILFQQERSSAETLAEDAL